MEERLMYNSQHTEKFEFSRTRQRAWLDCSVEEMLMYNSQHTSELKFSAHD